MVATTFVIFLVTVAFAPPASTATVTRNANCVDDFPGDFRHYEQMHTVTATFDGAVITGQPVHVTLDVQNSAGISYFDPFPSQLLASNITFQVDDGAAVSTMAFAFGSGHAGTTITPHGAPGSTLSIAWISAGALVAIPGGIGEGLYTCTAIDTTPAVAATIRAPGPSCNGEPATIIGTSRDDTLVGTSGRDVIVGGGGNDVIEGAGGDDVICGGAGNDTVSYRDAPSGVAVSLALGLASGGAGNDQLHQIEGIAGSSHGDLLIGGTGRDDLRGGPGNDALFGLAQSDTLDGGPGRDTIDGGMGTDTCTHGETLSSCP